MKKQTYIQILVRMYEEGDSRFLKFLRRGFHCLNQFELAQVAAMVNAPVIEISGGVEDTQAEARVDARAAYKDEEIRAARASAGEVLY